MRIENRNLILEGQTTRLVRVAMMTASGFRVARVAPALGRPLLDDDERPGAPPVLLIAEETWQNLFDRDAGILGQSIQLGRTTHTIVGVMPAGFRFPLNNHFWIPLQPDPVAYEPGSGPSIHVFGRLADGVSSRTPIHSTASTTSKLRGGCVSRSSRSACWSRSWRSM